jgi:hypothetical protein
VSRAKTSKSEKKRQRLVDEKPKVLWILVRDLEKMLTLWLRVTRYEEKCRYLAGFVGARAVRYRPAPAPSLYTVYIGPSTPPGSALLSTPRRATATRRSPYAPLDELAITNLGTCCTQKAGRKGRAGRFSSPVQVGHDVQVWAATATIKTVFRILEIRLFRREGWWNLYHLSNLYRNTPSLED